ncbi:MAG TPA: hypothetical protein VNQ34_00830 [Xanthobacteraceae bacterium]|nr:hypothetical protein [Xanthobacteraceae bacterium]
MSQSYHDIGDLDHNHELATALGDMVIAWARAETALISAFSHIAKINLNMACAAYYRIPTFEARTKFIRAMFDDWDGDSQGYKKDALFEEISKLNGLARARNDWVHGNWCANDDKTETVIFDYRRKPGEPGRRKPVKAADVRNHIMAVRERTRKIDALLPDHLHPDIL